jgi:hypothetical protein
MRSARAGLVGRGEPRSMAGIFYPALCGHGRACGWKYKYTLKQEIYGVE